jgi:hypothetical protein
MNPEIIDPIPLHWNVLERGVIVWCLTEIHGLPSKTFRELDPGVEHGENEHETGRNARLRRSEQKAEDNLKGSEQEIIEMSDGAIHNVPKLLQRGCNPKINALPAQLSPMTSK